MKKIIIVILTLCTIKAWSQQETNNNKSQTVISGRIAESVLVKYFAKEPPFITFYDHYNEEDNSTAKIIPLTLHDGRFSIRLKLKNETAYFGLGKGLLRSITHNIFLLQRGDSIFIEVKNLENVSFSGYGAEKLNYQHWAGKELWKDIRNWGVNDTWKVMMTYYKNRASKLLAITLDSLNKDNLFKQDSIKDLIRLNTASSISREYLINIFSYDLFPDTSYYHYLKNEVNFLITLQNGFVVSNPFLVKNSFMYIDYLFNLNKAIAKIKSNKPIAPFGIVYSNLKGEYAGLLRDEILPYCFLNMLKDNPDAVNYLAEAVNLVQDSTSKEIIKRAKSAKSTGAKAYNFDLETLDRKRIKLNDFRGKIVILETYYAGCVHCRELSIGMDSVAQYFKNRKDIVYISMEGVAHDFHVFEKSAKSGLYGFNKSIYAWTGGIGEHHPLLLYYQYNAYPNLLVIGKDGNIISANPEKPLDKERRGNFIALIEKNL